MGEETIKLGPGTLYFGVSGGDQQYILLPEVIDIEIVPPSVHVNRMETTFEILGKVTKDMILEICGVYDAIIQMCPNKRVTHLALYGKNKKIRKKNFNRAIKILEEKE